MREQKFIQLLAVFSDEEIADFQLFLESSYFKLKYRSVCTRLLLNILEKSKTKILNKIKFEFSKLDKKVLAASTFEDKENALNLLNVYLSAIFKNALIFIGVNDGRNQHPDIVRLSFFQERNLPKFFDKYFKKYKKEFYQKKQSEETLYLKLQLEKLAKGQLIVTANKKVNINANDLSIAVFNYQVLSSLKIICDQMNLSITNISDFDHSLINPFLSKLKEQSKIGFEEPVIELYFWAYQCFLDNANVDSLFEKINKFFNVIAVEEMVKLLKFSKNICIVKIINGDLGKYALVHQINKFSVEKEVFIQKGIISVRDFNNTIGIVARMKDFEWGHHFIEKYAQYLPKKDMEKNKQISQALLFFENRQFQEALDLLLGKNFEKDLYLECNRRNLVIKTQYELEVYEQAELLIDSFIRYLRIISQKKKMPAKLAQSYRLFLQELRKLIRLHFDVNLDDKAKAEKAAKLKSSIQNKQLVSKEWLLEKLLTLSPQPS